MKKRWLLAAFMAGALLALVVIGAAWLIDIARVLGSGVHGG